MHFFLDDDSAIVIYVKLIIKKIKDKRESIDNCSFVYLVHFLFLFFLVHFYFSFLLGKVNWRLERIFLFPAAVHYSNSHFFLLPPFIISTYNHQDYDLIERENKKKETIYKSFVIIVGNWWRGGEFRTTDCDFEKWIGFSFFLNF